MAAPMSSSRRIIVGVTGPFGSGATKIAEWLKGKGFVHAQIHQLIEGYLKDKGLDVQKLGKSERRSRLQSAGNDKRKDNPAYWVNLAISEVENQVGKKTSVVVDCLKNPGEVEALRERPNSFVLAVGASRDTRWSRVHEAYEDNQKQFLIDDDRDKEEERVSHGQNVTACVDMADFVVDNEATCMSEADWTENLFSQTGRFLSLAEEPGSLKPQAMEVYMNEAYCQSLQSQCLGRQVGAVIVAPLDAGNGKSLEVAVSSAYNDVPVGRPCALEHGGKCFRKIALDRAQAKVKCCPECGGALDAGKRCGPCNNEFKDFYPGKYLDICRAVHAEESAILKVAHLGGVSLKNATLYTTTFPCHLCALKIVATGIARVVWVEAYPHGEAKKMLDKGGVDLEQFRGVKARGYFRLFRKTWRPEELAAN